VDRNPWTRLPPPASIRSRPISVPGRGPSPPGPPVSPCGERAGPPAASGTPHRTGLGRLGCAGLWWHPAEERNAPLHARPGRLAPCSRRGRPLISTGVVFASRGPPRFAPGMNRNSRPNHSPAPCPRASTPALPRQSEARYPHPRRRHRRRRGPRRTVGVAERPDRPGRRGARYRRPSRPARRSSEGGHADRLSRTVHAWVGWDGSVSRQSMVSMTIIRQTRHPWNRPPSPIPGRMRVRKSLPSPIVAAGGRVRPRSGTHIDPCPIGRSRSGVRFAEGGAHGGRVRPGFR
jgi:hypothetical protein